MSDFTVLQSVLAYFNKALLITSLILCRNSLLENKPISHPQNLCKQQVCSVEEKYKLNYILDASDMLIVFVKYLLDVGKLIKHK